MVDKQFMTSQVEAYFTALSAMNQAGWQSLFAATGEICDPVGTPPKRVSESSAQFFGLLQKFYSQLDVKPEAIFIAGQSGAAHWQMQVTAKNQRQGSAAGISIFEFNEAGLLQKVSSYWDEAALMAQLKEG